MHISILMLARQNEINLNRGRVKWVVRAAEGDGGRKERKGKETPIYALMPDQQMFFHYFGLFSPFITCSRQRFLFLGQVNHSNSETEITNEAKGKSSGWSRPAGRSRANNTTCKTKGAHFLTWTICQIATTIAALRLGQEKSEGKEGRMEAELFHIKVNEFTTSNCGAKLIEKVYSPSRKAIPFSTC